MRRASRGCSRLGAAAGDFDVEPASVASVVAAGCHGDRLRRRKIAALRRGGGSNPVRELPKGRPGPTDGSELGCAFRELAEESGLQLEVPRGGCAKLGVEIYFTGRGCRGGPRALKKMRWYHHRVAAGEEGRWGPRTREVRFVTLRELQAATVTDGFLRRAGEAPSRAMPKELHLQPKRRSPAVEATEPGARARPKRKAPRGSAGPSCGAAAAAAATARGCARPASSAGARATGARALAGGPESKIAREARRGAAETPRARRPPSRKGGAGARARRDELRRQQGLGWRKRPRAAGDEEEEVADAESCAPTLLDEVEAGPPWRAAGEAGRDAAAAG
ncbi:unnamed protein product, partial [Prorocentrum cordatum]